MVNTLHLPQLQNITFLVAFFHLYPIPPIILVFFWTTQEKGHKIELKLQNPALLKNTKIFITMKTILYTTKTYKQSMNNYKI